MATQTPRPEKSLRPTPIFSLSTTSASGLVRVGSALYSVSDDLLSLTRIASDGQERQIPILAGELPEDLRERKAAKPDFESLFILGDQLVGFGSGSTTNRDRGFSFPSETLDSKTRELPKPISLRPLYERLRGKIPHLNIEGAVVHGKEILLAQRGNSAGAWSGVIRLDHTAVVEGISPGNEIGEGAYLADHDLSPELPLGYGFTDLATDPRDPNAVWFLAVREESKDAYEDGAFSGAILGELKFSKSGTPKVASLTTLEIEAKPEGLWLEPGDDGSLTAFLVTDADSSTVRSTLYGLLLNR